MMSALQELGLAFSWPKFLYTLILFALIALLVGEIYRLWIDRGLYVGKFEYFDAGARSETDGQAFALRVLDRHGELRQRLVEAEKAQYADELAFSPQTGAPIERSESVLSDLSIKIKEINVTDILGRLRSWVSTRREIRGSLSKSDSAWRSTVFVSGKPIALADGSTFSGSFLFDSLSGLDEAAFQIACSLVWLEAAKTQPTIAVIPRDEFCTWTDAWARYSLLLAQSKRVQGLNEEQKNALLHLYKHLTRHITAGVRYPKYFALRADVSSLLASHAEPSARPGYLEQAQSDQLRYLVLLNVDPKQRAATVEPLDEAAALPLLAKLRPAIPLTAGQIPSTLEQPWPRILTPAADSIRNAATATGLFRIYHRDKPGIYRDMHMVGFAVAPNVIATAGFSIVFDELKPNTESGGEIAVPDSYVAEFVFADAWPDSADTQITRHKIKRLLFTSNPRSAVSVALLAIEGHDVTKFPPLSLARPREITLRDGDYAAVIGFPAPDLRIPPPFIDALLGNGPRVKRLMPGRILSPGQARAEAGPVPLNANSIVTDSSTTGGVSGGPLIDLHSGGVIGMAIGGRWVGRTGKFAYALHRDGFFASEAMRAELTKVANGEVSFDALVASLPKPATPVIPQTSPDTEARGGRRGGYNEKFLAGPAIPLPQPPGSKRVDYVHFSAVLDPSRRIAALTAENVDGSQLRSIRRPMDGFRLDPRVPDHLQPDPTLFSESPFDRGTLVHRRAIAWGSVEEASAASLDVFHYTVTAPQHQRFNRDSWAELERFILEYVVERRIRATVFSGPVLAVDDPMFRGYQIPERFWKLVVIDGAPGAYRVAAFLLEQSIRDVQDGVEADVPRFDALTHRISVSSLEKLSGIDFGSLRDAKEF